MHGTESHEQAAGGGGPPRERRALALLVGLALALRVVWLDRIPTNVTADEADNLWTIFRAIEQGQPGLFGLDWKPAPAFSIHLQRAFMAVFGLTPFGLRLASAVLSTLALLPFYALARRVARPPAALAATALLATGPWYLHFSRSGWENVHVALYALLAAWALTVALERGELRWFALAGVGAALGLYGYFAGRLVLLALLAYAPLAAWWAGKERWRVVRGFAVLALVALALFAAQVPTLVAHWDAFNRRVVAVDVLRQPRPYLGETSDLGILRAQVQRTLAGFLLLDGTLFDNGRYGPVGQPPYDPATGLLVLLGLGLALRRWRATALWWVMLFVPLLGTQVLSAATPDLARAVVVAPFAYLFVALALDRLLALVPRRARGAAHGALLLGIATLAALNVRAYFAWIGSPEAAAARQPAVELAEFDLWQETLRRELRAGGFGFNVGQWHAMRPAPPPVQHEPPGPPLAPGDRPRADAYRLEGLVGAGQLRDPRGLAVGPDGTLSVADAAARVVLRFAADGTARGALGAGALREPVAIVVRPAGDLDILDAELGLVVRFGPDGQPKARLGADLGTYRPRGMALAANGDLYVADTGRQRLLVLAPDGRLRRTLAGEGRFDQPTQVVITADGGLLVAEPQRSRVQWLDGSGRLLATWPLRTRDTIHGPALALGPQRTVLLADPEAGRLQLLTYDGRVVAEISPPGRPLAPSAVAFGPRGELYVADRAQRAVLRFAPAGP